MRNLPKAGTVNTFFERLLEYMSQYDFEWKNRIEGISQEEIQELIEINLKQGKIFQYPEDYIIYLRKMGKKDDGLFTDAFLGNVCGDYETICRLIKSMNGSEWYLGEKNMIAVGYNEEFGDAYYMFFAQDDYVVGDEPTEEADGYEIIFSSLEKMLFQSAFKRVEQQALTCAQYIVCTKEEEHADDLLEQLVQVCRKFGMEMCWISDQANYYFWNEKCSLWLNTYDMIHGKILAEDESLLKDFLREVIKIQGYIFPDHFYSLV